MHLSFSADPPIFASGELAERINSARPIVRYFKGERGTFQDTSYLHAGSDLIWIHNNVTEDPDTVRSESSGRVKVGKKDLVRIWELALSGARYDGDRQPSDHQMDQPVRRFEMASISHCVHINWQRKYSVPDMVLGPK
jgi:hypothetical protein